MAEEYRKCKEEIHTNIKSKRIYVYEGTECENIYEMT